MKKLLVLLLALVMCVATLSACSLFPQEEEPAEEIVYKLDKAVAYVKSLYISEEVKPEGSDVGIVTKYADFERVSSVAVAGVSYDVTWTVDETDETKVKVVQGTGATATVIDVNERTTEDISFVLTATVKAGDGTSDTLTFNIFVPKYETITYEEFRAKKSGESATVEAIVVALNSKSAGNKRNHIFAVDAAGKGGYYAYDMESDPAKLGIEVGMTVAISGTVDIYNGMYEFKDAAARIINSEKTDITAIDVTNKFGAGEDILQYVGSLITIKGVEIGAQDLATASSQYLYFKLNGNESYIRTYVTDLPTSFTLITDEEGNQTCADKAVIDAAHAEKFGWTANVTGVLIAYNGAPYLMPISTDCFEYTELVQKTDAEKIAIELEALTMSSAFSDNAVVDLLQVGKYYDTVAFSWASDKDFAVIADGKLTITIPEDPATLTLTVTATCGEASATKTFEIKLAKGPMAIGDVLEMADGTKVIVQGEVIEVNTPWSDTFNNITVTISDGTNTLYVYRLATKVVVGDIITVTGEMATYNNNRQIAQGATATIDDPAPVQVTIAEALELEDGVRVIIKGTVAEIGTAWSDQYGNISVTVTDETGSLYIFRLATNVAVGDIVTITGKMATYNNNRQIAQGATAIVGEPEGPTIITVTEALELEDGTNVVVRGTVTEINTPWSDSYGNISVTITDGTNTLYLYRLATNVEVGDVIVVTGKMATYNDARQVAQGATAVIENGEGGDDTNNPEGGEDETPTVITIAEALDKADGTQVVVQGEVIEINTAWSDQYSNISVTISDGTNSLYLYRLATKVVVGDIITVTGNMATYSENRQIAQGATATIDDPAPVQVTIAEALELEDGVRVIIKGTVAEINTAWSDQYGNITVTVTDETGSLYVYRLATNVAVGDVVTITGKMGTYGETRQIAAGATAVIADENEAEIVTATISFADVANRTSWDSTQQTWAQNGITVTNEKSASTSPVADYSNPARFYKNSDVTVAVAEGTIAKLVFECNTGSYANALVASLAESDDYTVTANGQNVTVELTTAAASFKVTASGGQVRVNSITVYFA